MMAMSKKTDLFANVSASSVDFSTADRTEATEIHEDAEKKAREERDRMARMAIIDPGQLKAGPKNMGRPRTQPKTTLKTFRIKPETLKLFEGYAWRNHLTAQAALEKLILENCQEEEQQ